MSNFIVYALIGLGLGAIFALIGQAIVVVHRGSGVLNFATGAIGMFGAYVYSELHITAARWPWPLAMATALASCALLGAMTHLIIFRRLRSRSVTSQIVATLGLFATLTAVANLAFAPGGLAQTVPSLLPTTPLRILGSSSVGINQLLLAAIALVITAGLVVLQRRTKFGLATSAVAESPLIAATIGWSPDLIASATWAIGSALAAFAMIMIAPVVGMSVPDLSLLVIPGMLAALVGRFESVTLTFIGAIVIGVLESEVSWYISSPGWAGAVPIILVIIFLAIRGSVLPGRGEISQRLSSVGTGRIGLASVGWIIAGAALLDLISINWLSALGTSLIFAMVLLSIVVVTGYAGQLSLVQLEIAGVGAFLFAVFTIQFGMTAWLAMGAAVVATVLGATAVGALVVRTRGSNLAILTLGLATIIDQLVINNTWTNGGISVANLPTLRLFGINFNGLFYPRNYDVLLFVVLVFMALAVASLRRSDTGRRLLAVRGNERAAAAMGISVPGTKLYAFGVGAALAAVAGVFSEVQFTQADFSLFTVLGSIDSAMYAVIGGVGWIGGAAVGSANAPSGLGAQVLSVFFNPSGWLDLITGIAVLLIVLQSPDGLVPLNIQQARYLWCKIFRTPQPGLSASPLDRAKSKSESRPQRRPVRIEICDLTVRFGGQLALENINLDLNPGEILGLIGPNGAGKSTMIDVVSGFQRQTSGSVRVDGKAIDHLSPSQRAGEGLSRSFQSLELFDDMTVLDNLQSASGHRRRAYLADLIWPRRSSLNAPAMAAVSGLSIGAILNRRPDELDFAHRRLVAIARALSISPTALFLDEPAAGLDEHERREFVRLLRFLRAEWGFGILLVEHDVDLVFEVSDRVVALDAGRIIASGSPNAVRADAAVIESYLGFADKVPSESAQGNGTP